MSAPPTIKGTIPAPARLDKALAEATELSRARLQGLIADGHVTIDGKAATSPSTKVAAGALFEITIPPAADAEAQAQDIPLTVVFEDEHLIVVDKPAGMVVHPAAGNADGTLVNALLHHCRGQLSGIGGVARPGIVHRIDKDTSGLLVVAKSDAAHEGLAKQFADHSIERAYTAVASGLLLAGSGTVDAPLARSSANRKKMAVVENGRGKRAVTHWTKQANLNAASLIECRLETGRTHQVRVHMAHLGHPLIGDPFYGRTKKEHRAILKELGFSRQALHAARLGFVHPASGDRLSFESALPSDMRELLDALHV